jgi:hypothetical protein
MIDAILRFINTMGSVTKKEQVLKNTDVIFTGIQNEIIPLLKEIIDKDPKIINENLFLKNIVNMSKDNYKDNYDFINELVKFFENVIKHEKEINKIIDESLSEIITDKTATAKDLAILKVISDIGSMSLYIADLMYYCLLLNDETNYPKIKIKQIKENGIVFTSLFNVYKNNLNDIIKKLPRVSSELINDKADANVSMLSKLLHATGLVVDLPVSNGFSNNPIYHIRMYLVDREIKKYEALKEKRKLIELKLLELKLEENGDSNPKLKKQIEYYEDKLSGIEYDIKEIEED